MDVEIVPYDPVFYPGYLHHKVNLMVEINSMAGEGVWCLLSPIDSRKHDDDECFDSSVAILCNDSLYYDGLVAGTKVPIKFNGPDMPEIDLDWINKNFKLK